MFNTALAETAIAVATSRNGDLLSLLIMLLLMLVHNCFWGFITKRVARDKTTKHGFLWGFFLGVIGIIVVACMPNKTKKDE